MDEGPIDPFNPYGRRYSPRAWPPRAVDDTQEVPVVAVPRADDTREVPVVAVPATEPPPPAYGEVTPPAAPTTAASPTPPVPPPWPTGVPEPTTATPAPVTFEPELTVPPELVPASKRRLRKPLVLVGGGVVALVALVVALVVTLLPGPGGDGDIAAAQEPKTSAATESGSASADTDESTSPSKKSEPKPDDGSSEPADDGVEDDPPTEAAPTVPSRPTKFGAWFAGNGTYQGKWAKPADDGGSDIVSYVVGDCQGNNLAFVDSRTFTVTVSAERLNCMSVYAVNSQGLGQDAQHQIDNNP